MDVFLVSDKIKYIISKFYLIHVKTKQRSSQIDDINLLVFTHFITQILKIFIAIFNDLLQASEVFVRPSL